MLKADSVKYFSQMAEFPWEPVAKRVCGITAAAMAITYFQPTVTPMAVLKKVCDLHTVPNDWPCVYLTVKQGEDEINVPVAESLDEAMTSELTGMNLTNKNSRKNDRYQPVFSLVRGYDHRGSVRLFESFGIKAEMKGDKNKPIQADELREMIKGGAMFMPSVTRLLTTQVGRITEILTTHVVLITDLVHFADRDWYYIMDPYSLNGEKIEYLQPVAGFHKVAFNGYGSLIFNKPL